MKYTKQTGKSYNAGYAVADAVRKTAAFTVAVPAVIVLGAATATTATYRGAKNTAAEVAGVTASFCAGFGRAFKDRAAQRKEAKRAAAEPVLEPVDNVVAMKPRKPRVRVVDGQVVQAME